MAVWRYVVGNLARRAPTLPVAVSPALEDTELPLANLADDYPDTLGGLQWRSDGAYDVDFYLNLRAGSSERADARRDGRISSTTWRAPLGFPRTLQTGAPTEAGTRPSAFSARATRISPSCRARRSSSMSAF